MTTTPDDPQIPIVPGPSYEPPTPPYAVPAPVQRPAPAQPPEWRPSRVAGNTVVVIITIVGLICGIPLLLCACTTALGSFDFNSH